MRVIPEPEAEAIVEPEMPEPELLAVAVGFCCFLMERLGDFRELFDFVSAFVLENVPFRSLVNWLAFGLFSWYWNDNLTNAELIRKVLDG